jgi:hypothetical protein
MMGEFWLLMIAICMGILVGVAAFIIVNLIKSF